MAPVTFPDGFLWGAATAAYQIEGAVAEDGRTPSIWDTFAHTPGRTLHGDTGDVACDSYHRLDEDLGLIAELGLRAYRFAPSWPRLQPGGSGPLNPRAVDHYRRLLDGLRERGVRSMLTLYHWDLPQELQDAGGWPARPTAERFAEYAGLVAGAFGSEVDLWITLNEPWCSSFLAHLHGAHAPGVRDEAAALAAAHHLLLGHGLAVGALRAAGVADGLGITLNLTALHPASDDEADRAATARLDGEQNRWFLEQLLHGRHPADLVEHYAAASDLAFARDGDLATIAAPVDLLGVNFYERKAVAADPADPRGAVELPDPEPVTSMGWGAHPEGLVEVLTRVSAMRPDLPLYVTESGAGFHDYVTPEGLVHDPERVAYLDAHFRAAAQAIAEGVDLRGYVVWTLMDNFEWTWGYSQRFGLFHVDFATQTRRPKQSARWYRDVIAANGLP
jgi:beta-glucosidase